MPRIAEIRIGLTNVTSPKALHLLLMESLDFPGWSGCNWNAFWDAITALVEMPEQLVLEGWDDFSLRMPFEAQVMQQCFEDMSEQYPKFASKVVYL